MGRILGIDVGTKTLGLAISDETGTVALPLEVIRRAGMRRDIERLAAIVAERGVTAAVIGLPLEMSGERGAMADEAEAVADALAARCRIPVHRWDERLTTVAAERMLIRADVSRKRRKQVVDKIAATLILQGWLDRRNLPGGGSLPPIPPAPGGRG